VDYVRDMAAVGTNVRLYFWVSAIEGTARGIYSVVFNLFVLSLGIAAGRLGSIAAAAPLATAVGSVIAGVAADAVGYKRALIAVYAALAASIWLQSATASPKVMVLAGLLGGLASAGGYVMRLPFLAHNTSAGRLPYAMSTSLVLYNLANSLGSLLGGYAPGRVARLLPDLSAAYRLSLYASAAVAALALIPAARMTETPEGRERRLDASRYLWRLDVMTVKVACVALIRGISLGVAIPFLNVLFVHHLGASREFFGTMRALEILPITIATALAPAFSAALGMVPLIAFLRVGAAVPMWIMAVTGAPMIGAFGNWAYRAATCMAQPLTFSLAMQAVPEQARGAAASWLNVAFWLGNTMAAPMTGWFMARSDYRSPFQVAAGATVVAGVLNLVFFRNLAGKQRRQHRAA
jgi:MFS family permease